MAKPLGTTGLLVAPQEASGAQGKPNSSGGWSNGRDPLVAWLEAGASEREGTDRQLSTKENNRNLTETNTSDSDIK